MFALLTQVFAILLLFISIATAQSVIFTQYPTQVVQGQSYPISWEAGGAPVTIELIRTGAPIGEEDDEPLTRTLFTGAGNTFNWFVGDDEDGGTSFALRLTPQGNPASALTSGNVWIIDGEDGILANGQVITASVPNGPAPSGLGSAAADASSLPATPSSVGSDTASIASSSGVGVLPSSAPAPTARATQTVTFTSVGSSFTFTATVGSGATDALSAGPETLTFISAGQTFMTTIAAATTAPTSTEAAALGNSGGGISGGAIAGIVIGVITILAIVAVFFWLRRRRQRQKTMAGNNYSSSPISTFISGGKRALSKRESANDEVSTGVSEKDAQSSSVVSPFSPHTSEMDGGGSSAMPMSAEYTGSSIMSSEIDGTTRHEMNALPPTYELPAEEVQVTREMDSNASYPATCVSVSRSGTMSNAGPVRKD